MTKYKKVKINGSKYFHIFRRTDGTDFQIETNGADYEQLATPTHIDPRHPDGIYIGSYARNRYDTVDGDLHPTQYALGDDPRFVEMFLDDGDVHNVEREKMASDGTLLDATVLKRKKIVPTFLWQLPQ